MIVTAGSRRRPVLEHVIDETLRIHFFVASRRRLPDARNSDVSSSRILFSGVDGPTKRDIVATATAFTARSIAQAIAKFVF